ncbi:MAG: hypothetical protein AB7V58_04725 [Solirubrobacterales bacterium]
MTAGSNPSGEPQTAPLPVAPSSDQHHQPGATPADQSLAPPSLASSAGDACPSCGARMALDQRYCLNCGNRRGDPRLPFMDAVVFMEAAKHPRDDPAAAAAAAPPPPPQKSGLSPGTTLIAGIATLILAVGVGVLIGRSGDSSGTPVASPKPTVIQVGGGSGSGEVETAGESGTAEKAAGKKASKSEAAGGGKKTKKAPPEKEVDSSGTSKAAAEVLKPSGDVKLPPPTAQVGGDCEKGTSGCSDSGEFNGEFFGE